jgi:tetratricopeptide (TPR) repeat protein
MKHIPGIAPGLLLLSLAATGLLTRAQSAPLPPGTTTTDSPAPAPRTQGTLADTMPVPLADAEGKLDARDYPGAKALLDPYLSAHPTDARALFDRGYIADAEDHPTEAEGFYRKAIAADPQQFESRLALGLLLASRSQSDPAVAAEAKEQLKAATTLQPRPANPAAQAQAGRALARLLVKSDPEGARQALLGALKISPETTADTLLTAQIAESAGDTETAEEAYKGLLASAPAGSDEALAANAGLSHLLIANKQYTDAELLLRKTLTRNSGDPVLNTQLANVLMEENKPEEAIAVLENLHQAQPADRGVSRMLADLYTQTGQAEKADPLYVQLLTGSNGQGDAQLLAARGDNLVRQKRFKEAVGVLQQSVKLDPTNGQAWSSLAFAASVDHQPQVTLDALTMRSKVMSDTPATYFLAATAYDSLHLTKRAVEMYKQFLAVAGGKFPDEEWEAKHRLTALDR